MPKIGQAITYVDPRGNDRPAVVTNVFGSDANASVNVVFVNEDEDQTDNYGRKIERATSVPAKSGQPAHGNFWRE